MSENKMDRLYKLLPTVYRLRDFERGQPLRALLAVIESEIELLEDDISRLYENWFIETCDEWVVPYLGDLLGVRNLLPLQRGVFSQRAYVANTLAYRRRKGTATMLEQLAHDVTGWPAKSVEFFDLLGATQYLNHLRPQKGSTVNLRDADRLELINGPFECAAHTVEVRHIDNGRGRYNIPNLGLFLWRLQDYPIERVTARAVTDSAEWRYTFHPLGYDIPLFNIPQTETQITQLTGEVNVPGTLRRRPLYDELEARRQAVVADQTPRTLYFGERPVLQIYVNGNEKPLNPKEIVICNLADWQRPESQSFTQPDSEKFNTEVAVDPVLGRLAFLGSTMPSKIEVSYAYGFSGDVGGGPYDRRRSPIQDDESAGLDTVANPKAIELPLGVPSDYGTIADALAEWNTKGNKPAVITIEDNATYQAGPSGLTINMAGDELVIQAVNGHRPALIGDITVTGCSNQAKLTLNGLLIAGNLHVQGTLAELNILHCTFAPGTAHIENKLTVNSPNYHLQLTIDHSIVGPLRLPWQMACLTVKDSIVQSPLLDGESIAIAAADSSEQAGPPTTLQRTTVFGAVKVKELKLASEAIFNDLVWAERHQAGCVRFSFVPNGSRTPRRYRCQPDLAIAKRAQELGIDSLEELPATEKSLILARTRPSFTSTQYIQPGFAQLSLSCAEEIRTGAEDGSEMGVFSCLKHPQREANLLTSLEEYLRFGLEAGIFYAT